MSTTNYPDGTNSRHFDEPSRMQVLEIRDLLKNGPLTVNGVEFDFACSVVLKRRGDDGTMELDSLDWDSSKVTVIVPTSNDTETFPIAELPRRWEKDFEQAIEAEALKQGGKSCKWEDEESEDV